MRIVIVGSAHSVHIRKIADSLVARGHQVTVFSEESALTESSPQQYSSGVSLKDKWPVNKRARKVWLILKLNCFLFFSRADVVWFVYASSYGLLTKKVFTYAKKVTSVWGSDILINSYKNAYLDKISKSLDSADLIFSTSEFLRTHTRRLTSSRMVLTPYGPNDAFFEVVGKSHSYDREPHEALKIARTFDRFILCTKWLKSVYGIDILISAIIEDPDYFRASNTGVIICGEGVDARSFKETVKSNHIEDLVKFVGYQTEKEVICLLGNADLAVFPSRSESFGVSLLECFAQEVPVICSNAGGFNELSQGGKYGRVVSSMDPRDYLEEIKSVLDEGPGYNLIDAKSFSQCFAWSKCMDHMECALDGLSGKQAGVVDFHLDSDRENAIFMHTEPRIVNTNLTRAREIRIAGFRNSLMKTYNLQEICAGQVVNGNYKKMIEGVFEVSRPRLVYIEGTSSMLSSFTRRIRELKSVLQTAQSQKIPVVYYLPDAHEFWDDYVISTRSATTVHLARYRKKKLLNLLANYCVIIAFPSGEFRAALYSRLDIATRDKLNANKSLILPPACATKSIGVINDNQSICYVYAGGVGPFYKLHRLLISIIQSTCSVNALFYMRKGDLRVLDAKYRALIVNAKLNIHHGPLPYSVQGVSPVGLLVMEPIDYISVAIPLKFYSYLERGWPVLCFKGTAVGNIVTKYGLGWAISASVSELAGFFESNKALDDYSEIQKSIGMYTASNQWDNRVQQIAEAAE